MATARAPKAGARRAGTKKKERKSIPHGVASIARDVQQHHRVDHRSGGQRAFLVERRPYRLQGLAQGNSVRCPGGGAECRAAAQEHGVRSVDVKVKGPGAGRESRHPRSGRTGLDIKSIKDVTPIPHNGCRPPKRRRV